jgi:hypothetical protein
MPKMRAKFQVQSVTKFQGGQEQLKMSAVCKSGGYPADGSDEDNTFSLFSPQGDLTLTVNNPALAGQIQPGQKFYLDFTLAE